jgi:hypothetical protein
MATVNQVEADSDGFVAWVSTGIVGQDRCIIGDRLYYPVV